MSSTSLIFSHSLEELVAQFATAYKESIKDPFHPPEIVFASPISKQWLTQELTESMKVVAGIQGKYIESYLWDGLAKDYLYEGQYPVKMLKVEVLQHHLLTLLEESTLLEIEADFLLEYLKEEGQINEVKRIQLAMKLASLFLEYELNRPPVIGKEVPGLADTWIAGDSYLRTFESRSLDEEIFQEEQWQMRLYQRLFSESSSSGVEGVLPRKGEIQYLTLPQLWKLRLSNEVGQLLGEAECIEVLQSLFGTKDVFLFAISSPAHFHRNLLATLSQFKPIHAYLLNPCGAFWEDLERYQPSSQTLTAMVKEYLTLAPESFGAESLEAIESLKMKSSEGENKLLQLWAHAGRENITLWSQFADYDFDYLSPSIGAKDPSHELNLLESLQESIIEREALSIESESLSADHSLVILKAPSKVREMETLRDLIFEMMNSSPAYGLEDLKPHEIGIYIPDLESYLGAIEQVFGASSVGRLGHLPYSILSVNAAHSWYSRAVTSMIALIEGEFNRSNLSQFFRNPFVQEALGVSREVIDQWEIWIDELNIYRGYQADDLVQYGDAVATPLKTWKLAIDRMIAAWMSDTRVDELEPWIDQSYADEEVKVKFCDSIQRLHQSLERFAHCKQSSDYQATMIEFLNQWVAIPLEYLSEKTVRTQLMSRLSQYSEQSDSQRIEEFCAWLKANLEGDIPGRNDAKAGHIVFGSLSHAQILPYRVIMIAGLNGGAFPGQMNSSAIDLLSSVRILGDHHSVNNHKLAFLELILQAKERLFLSYQSYNIQKEEELQPSSVLLELQSYFSERSVPLKIFDIPLLSRDLSLFQQWIPEEDQSRYHEYFLASSGRVNWKSWSPRDLAYWENSAPPLSEATFYKAHPPLIRKTYLRSFLNSPLDFHLQKHLGLYDQDHVDISTSFESPYSMDSLESSIIIKQVIDEFTQVYWSKLDEGMIFETPLEDFVTTQVESALRSQIQSGALPEGHFESRQVQEIQSHLLAVCHCLSEHLTLENYQKSGVEWQPVVPVGDNSLQFEQPLMFRLEGKLHLIKINTSKTTEYGRYPLDLWLDALYLNLFHEEEVTLVHLGIADRASSQASWLETTYSITRESSEQYLMRLLNEIIDEQSDYREHLPFGTLTRLLGGKVTQFTPENLTSDQFREILEKDNPRDSGYYPETEMIHMIETHVPEDLYEKFHQRFGAFFQLEELV